MIGGRASLGTRLTLLVAGLASLALGVLGGVTMWALDAHFEAQDRGTLHSHLQQARTLIAQADSAAAMTALPARLDSSFASHHDLAVRVQAPDGSVWFEQNASAMPATLMQQVGVTHPVPIITWREGEHAWRGSAMLMTSALDGASPLTVAMALDIHHHEAFIANFRRALIGYVLLTGLGCALLAWWAVRRALKPLHLMGRKAARIGSGDLDERMPVEAVPAELAELASALNAMLERLQESFERLTRFSSDIAHELRTPLSNLLTQTQVTLGQARTSAEYREVLASNAEELERLARTVADMLLLAKAQHGHLLPSREPVVLADEVHALFDFYEALAEDRGVALRLQGAATVPGDRLMLRRAMNNLLSNALRYTPRGEAIDVRIERHGDRVSVAVRNAGTPIPPAVLSRLFERFYRAESDRSHEIGASEGAGLGLAIAQAIVQAHGGSVRAFSEHDGNVFEIVLPARASP
ncbi:MULTISPECIES: heavy metal sensor histidine kinase [unclassified Diaphorobacter]|uniref:heavy metal sensor histidine kinase n=1 Tax=unclassified Diaphorobacter TaxID=2649760 RepID=UPI002102DB8C|nr:MULTISPECIES: heavy metal sensor histidine kinase [unclassified Diaphorobacter]